MDIMNINNPRIYVLGGSGSGKTRMSHHIAAALRASGCTPVLIDGPVRQQDGEIPEPLPFARHGEVFIETGEAIVTDVIQDLGLGGLGPQAKPQL